MGKLLATVAVLLAVLTGCGRNSMLGPPTPEGAIDLGGPVVPTAPTPAGWDPQSVEPESRAQARDLTVAHLVRTFRALPPGYAFDATRFGASRASIIGCDDNDTTDDGPTRLDAAGDIRLPPGVDSAAAAEAFGEVWRSLGWYAYTDDRWHEPNQFAVTPDGYRFMISTATVPGPPGLSASSPCFPRYKALDEAPFPVRITADGG